MKRKQSGFKIMMRLIKLVKPLAFFMVLAVILGVTGFLCAIQITVVGSMTLLTAAGINGGLAIKNGMYLHYYFCGFAWLSSLRRASVQPLYCIQVACHYS